MVEIASRMKLVRGGICHVCASVNERYSHEAVVVHMPGRQRGSGLNTSGMARSFSKLAC